MQTNVSIRGIEMGKIAKCFSAFLILMYATASMNFFTYLVQGAPSALDSENVSLGLPKSIQDHIRSKLPYIDPALIGIKESARVILIVNDNANFSQIASCMRSCRVTPSLGGIRFVLGVVKPENLESLATNTCTLAILKDREVSFVSSPHDALRNGSFLKNMKQPQPNETPNKLPAGTPAQNVSMREVVKIMNATRVWDEFGVTGDGVTIAIVDTGVDYGSLGLGYWNDVMARDILGYPATFDADAMCLVYTDTTLTAFTNASGTFIPTAGLNPLVYMVGGFISYFSRLFGDVFPSDMDVTGILDDGDECHWGIMFQSLFGLDLFPVLVIDSNTDGVYDTVYVDMSFDWCWIPYWYYLVTGGTWPYWPAPWPPDFSFADETPLDITNSVGARDFTGDGIYDLSVSSLGYFLDVWGASPNEEDRGLVLQPIDKSGNYACFVYDFYGHGTSCASCAAGRDLGHPFFGSGIAYDAKIMGVTALYMGDVIEGELWAAGFDLIPGTEGWWYIPGYGTVYGFWMYTGNHKADIISNSWGSSAWALYSWMDQVPWYDVLTMLEDALTIPGYFDPFYPGTIVVHAGGNGGAGYGTFTEPGYSTLAISVGASTSMNWTYYYFGFAGGYYDEVIPWSARGPTALGTVKPDVLGVGAFGFAPTAVFLGLGNGLYAFELFGGTSMATPLVAGSAALVVQAFKETYADSPTHEIVKTTLKSTAVDLGYDPFLQGAGRVDCYGAVSLVKGDKGIIVFSDATWRNVLESIKLAAEINIYLSGELIPFAYPPLITDTSWFAGTVKPGENTTAEFVVYNPTSGDANISIVPVTHRQIGSTIVLEGSTGPMPDDWAVYGWIWGNITKLSNSIIPEDADLMTVSLVYSYDYFDPEKNYTWNQRLGIMIQDWNDTNGDGNVGIEEVWQLNYGYNVGTTNIATVGFPKLKFKDTPIIFVYQRNSTTIESIPFKLHIKFYKRVSWNWITPSTTELTVPAGDYASFNATLTVPPDASQGVYEGQIIVNLNGKRIAVPVSVNVPTIVPDQQLVYNITSPQYDSPYNSFTVEGYFDWNWRYEAGDWKSWYFIFEDPSILAAFACAEWEGNMTDVDMFSIHPMGIIMDGTGQYWRGGGVFQWNTRTGSTEERVFMYTGPIPYAPPMPNVYTVLLHNVLFDGSTFPEQLNCTVRMIKVDPASMTRLVVPAGESKSVSFTLSTGIKLTNVAFMPSGPIEIEPTNVEEIPEMGSQTINVVVEVPPYWYPGKYLAAVYVIASEFPMSIPIYIEIDVPTVEKLDIQLDVGEIHFSGEIADVYVQISHQGAPFNLTETIQLKLWYRNAAGEYLQTTIYAHLLDSGLYVAEFEVPVGATSCCLIISVDQYFEDANALYRGASMDSFSLSSTLNGWNAYLQSISSDMVTIKTDLGTINMKLNSINATLSGLIINSKGEILANIATALGTVRADLQTINAYLRSINGTTVEIKTLLGNIETSISTIGLKVQLIEGNVTLIRTSLGEIKGIIEQVKDGVATIKIDIGTLQVNVNEIQGYTKNIPQDLPQTTSQNLIVAYVATALALIAAACSAATLIKLGKKASRT
jgi:subtilisin family serine protease